MKKIAILMLVVVFLCTGCAKSHSAEKISLAGIPVEGVRVSQKTIPITIELPGVVMSQEEVTHSFEFAGSLESVFVKEGDVVTKDQVLAQMDKVDYEDALAVGRLSVVEAKARHTQFQLAMTQAEKQMVDLKKSYNQMEILYETGAVSKDQLDAEKLALDNSKTLYLNAKENAEAIGLANYQRSLTNYDQLDREINSGQLVAKCDGIIKRISVEEDNKVTKNQNVLTIGSKGMEVHLGLSSDEKQLVSQGDEVLIDYGGRLVAGHVKSIVQTINMETLLYETVIGFDEKLPLHAIVRVSIVIGLEEGVSVPLHAVYNDGAPYVFTLENDEAVRTYVTILAYDGTQVILEAFDDEKTIITTGSKGLRGGEKVLLEDEVSL